MYTVVYVQESMITVNKTDENRTETETKKKTERKQYPKRERKYVQR